MSDTVAGKLKKISPHTIFEATDLWVREALIYSIENKSALPWR
jgi:hypothetical protein